MHPAPISRAPHPRLLPQAPGWAATATATPLSRPTPLATWSSARASGARQEPTAGEVGSLRRFQWLWFGSNACGSRAPYFGWRHASQPAPRRHAEHAHRPAASPHSLLPSPSPCTPCRSAVTLMTEQVERLMYELSTWRASPELQVGGCCSLEPAGCCNRRGAPTRSCAVCGVARPCHTSARLPHRAGVRRRPLRIICRELARDGAASNTDNNPLMLLCCRAGARPGGAGQAVCGGGGRVPGDQEEHVREGGGDGRFRGDNYHQGGVGGGEVQPTLLPLLPASRCATCCCVRFLSRWASEAVQAAPPACNLPPRWLAGCILTCCFPPVVCFRRYDVVFMSSNEPYRLVLSDVRARLQRTK